MRVAWNDHSPPNEGPDERPCVPGTECHSVYEPCPHLPRAHAGGPGSGPTPDGGTEPGRSTQPARRPIAAAPQTPALGVASKRGTVGGRPTTSGPQTVLGGVYGPGGRTNGVLDGGMPSHKPPKAQGWRGGGRVQRGGGSPPSATESQWPRRAAPLNVIFCGPARGWGWGGGW